MTDEIATRAGVQVLVCSPEGPPIATVQDALDLIGAAFSGAEIAIIAVQRLDARFFELSNGFAGEVMQKFVNYRVKLVIIGDVSGHGKAFRDLVYESNKGRQVWFLPSVEDLDARLRLSATF